MKGLARAVEAGDLPPDAPRALAARLCAAERRASDVLGLANTAVQRSKARACFLQFR